MVSIKRLIIDLEPLVKQYGSAVDFKAELDKILESTGLSYVNCILCVADMQSLKSKQSVEPTYTDGKDRSVAAVKTRDFRTRQVQNALLPLGAMLIKKHGHESSDVIYTLEQKLPSYITWTADIEDGEPSRDMPPVLLEGLTIIPGANLKDAKKTLVTSRNMQSLLPAIQQQIDDAPLVALDIETYTPPESDAWLKKNKKKVDWFGSLLAGFSITVGRNLQHTYYFSVAHKDTDNITVQQAGNIMGGIGKTTVVHNNSFELPVIKNNIPHIKGPAVYKGFLPYVYDSQLMAIYVDENDKAGLKHLSKRYFRYDQVSYEEVTKGRKMNELTGMEVLDYGCDDTIMTAALANYCSLIMSLEGTWSAYDRCEHFSSYLLAQTMLHGVRFDEEQRKRMEKANLAEQEKVKNAVTAYLISRDWPGSSFHPFTELNSASVKEAFKIAAGKPLKTSAKLLKSLAKACKGQGESTLALLVELGDVEKVNEYCMECFEPDPQLKTNSPKQMKALLYEDSGMGLPIRRRNKLSAKMRADGVQDGNPKTDESAIMTALIEDVPEEDPRRPVLQNMLRLRELGTEMSLFLTPYKFMPHWKDGRVHYSPGQSRATSGRATPAAPNIAQVAKESELRRIYVPLEDDQVWLSLDFEQQEIKIAGNRADDDVVKSCYIGEPSQLRDIHALTASEVALLKGMEFLSTYHNFMLALKDDTHKLHDTAKKLRRSAKAVTFGDLFNISAYGLALQLFIPEEEAQSFLDAKAAAFPKTAQWKKDMAIQHIEDGYATDAVGRRRHLPANIKAMDDWAQKKYTRSSGNFEIQGSAASQVKIVQSEIWTSGMLEEFNMYFMMAVHDEMNFSVHPDLLDKIVPRTHAVMTRPFEGYGDIPVTSSIEVGPNFGQLEEKNYDL